MNTATMNKAWKTEDKPVEAAPTREFSYHDRCDRCGYQAFFVALRVRPKADARFPDEKHQEMLFCKHHGEKHTPVLATEGWTVLDFTDMLNEKPSVSANAD